MGNWTSKFRRGFVVLVSFKTNDEKMTIRRPAVIVNVDLIKEEATVLPCISDGKNVPPEKKLLIEANSWEGRAAGLRRDMVVDCRFLANIPMALLASKIGHFDENIMQKLDKLVND